MIVAEMNQSRLKGRQRLPERLVVETLKEITKALRIKKNIEISIAFVSEPEMKKLNQTWRGKNRVTDVLSFELEQGEVFGEVLICLEQAARQAKVMGHSVRDEIMFLLVHGILHLFGYDHERPSDEKRMFSLQKKILLRLGIDPRV
ncbi:rRNA maturation RNase YbeY [Candidatus Uhrbacteria bacterium]|nr:rRNA maturation RNase YbeY [Candidatus Uhrbacteria bacterium]